MNAFTSAELIDWLDRKIAAMGPGKVIPPVDILRDEFCERARGRAKSALEVAINSRLEDQGAAIEVAFGIIEEQHGFAGEGSGANFLIEFLIIFGHGGQGGDAEVSNDGQVAEGGFACAFGVGAEEEARAQGAWGEEMFTIQSEYLG